MSDLYTGTPSSPKSTTISPFTNGIIRNLPTTSIPDGAALDLCEAHVYPEGLERREGFDYYVKGTLAPVPFAFVDEVIEDTILFTTSTGTRQFLVLTNRMLYLQAGGVFTPVKWVRDYTKTTLVGAVITDSTGGRNFTTDNVVAGMYVRLVTTLGAIEYYEIQTVGTSTLTLVSSPAGTYNATFTVVKVFEAGDPFIVDWTQTPTRTYFTDGQPTGVVYYDGLVMQKLDIKNSTPAVSMLGCRVIAYFKDRLWFGYCIEADSSIVRNRVRWSTALNDARVETASYQDLADFGGEILKIAPLGQYNIVYLSDGLAYGRQSNLTGLPYVYNKIETGNAGLVGMRAVSGSLNAHYIVSSSDVYVLTGDLGIASLGASISNISLKVSTSKARTIVRPDPARKRMLFGFVVGGQRVNVVFAYYFETKAWSKIERDVAAIGSVGAFTADTLGDYPTSDWNDFPGRTYNSFRGELSDQTLYWADYNGFLFYSSPNSDSDSSLSYIAPDWVATPSPIPWCLETKDFNFGDGEIIKTVTRLGVRATDVDVARAADIEIAVEGSVDRGLSWKPLGTMTLAVGDDETAINFLLTGSTARFRLTSSSIVTPWRLEELAIRVRGRGLETHIGDLHG